MTDQTVWPVSPTQADVKLTTGSLADF